MRVVFETLAKTTFFFFYFSFFQIPTKFAIDKGRISPETFSFNKIFQDCFILIYIFLLISIQSITNFSLLYTYLYW